MFGFALKSILIFLLFNSIFHLMLIAKKNKKTLKALYLASSYAVWLADWFRFFFSLFICLFSLFINYIVVYFVQSYFYSLYNHWICQYSSLVISKIKIWYKYLLKNMNMLAVVWVFKLATFSPLLYRFTKVSIVYPVQLTPRYYPLQKAVNDS